jgi:hypothetical protein
LVWILPKYFGLDGVWMALPISDGVASLLTGTCLFMELRRLDTRHQEATALEARDPVPEIERVAVPEDAA